SHSSPEGNMRTLNSPFEIVYPRDNSNRQTPVELNHYQRQTQPNTYLIPDFNNQLRVREVQKAGSSFIEHVGYEDMYKVEDNNFKIWSSTLTPQVLSSTTPT